MSLGAVVKNRLSCINATAENSSRTIPTIMMRASSTESSMVNSLPYRMRVTSSPTSTAGISAKTMPGNSMPFTWNHFWW